MAVKINDNFTTSLSASTTAASAALAACDCVTVCKSLYAFIVASNLSPSPMLDVNGTGSLF